MSGHSRSSGRKGLRSSGRNGLPRRDFLKRSGLVVAGVAAGPTILQACANGDDVTGQDGDGQQAENLLDRARDQGFIRVGFANERPYGFADEGGNLTGEAPEVAKAIFEELDIPEIDGVLTDFGSLIAGLDAGRFDVIAAGMFITPERCEQVLFTDPDYCAPQAFGVQSGNPLGLNNYEDVAENDEAQLGVLRGAVEVGYAESAGVPEDRMTVLDTPQTMVEALSIGDVDVIGLTSITIRTNLEGREDLEVTDTFVPVVDGEEQLGCGGYGFRMENQEARDEFNEVLSQFQDEERILPIVEEFGFGADEVNLAKDKTADELCQA